MTSENRKSWYDKSHPGGFVVGNEIIGPHLFHIFSSLRKARRKNARKKKLRRPKIGGSLRVAVLGDSTTSCCTTYPLPNWESEVAARRNGIDQYFSQRGISNPFAPVCYYAVPNTCLDNSNVGFVSQLACILADHKRDPFDAILIVGGWNNYFIQDSACESFKNLLKGNAEAHNFWIPNGIPWSRDKLAKCFTEGDYPQP